MNVNIELTGINTKERLLRELKNIIENIERFDRFDAIRNIPHYGCVKVIKDGEYAKYALIDDRNDKVIGYYTEEQYEAAKLDQFDHSSAYIKTITLD